MSMRAADDETRPGVSLTKGSKEEKAARAELLARTLAANACEEPVGRVVVSLTEEAILLGESKYYYAVADENGKLVIKGDGDPAHPPGNRAQDVVFSVTRAEGDKLGVYWEKNDLPGGLIRLIGRYWESAKTYKVKLTANHQGKTGELQVEVKKPTRLLTPGQSPTYRLSRDVFNNEISIDDTCIVYGGRYGIPPQFLKGQMEQEADPYGDQFNPSYRYEPYTVQFWSKVKNRRTNPFFVQSVNVNDPPIPPHANVRTIEYPYPNKKVWDMIYDHSQLVVNTNDESHKIYGVRNGDGSMNFAPYESTDVAKTYKTLLEELRENYDGTEAIAKANEKIIVFLRDKWHGGLQRIDAQTRIASSYGLLQMLYTTALKRGYKEDRAHLPEDINMTSVVMALSLKYQKELLQAKLGCDLEESGNWPAGFEKCFEWIVYRKWNSKSSYPGSVMRKAQHYLPQN